MEGLDDISLTLTQEDAIRAYEEARPAFKPRTLPARHLPAQEVVSARATDIPRPLSGTGRAGNGGAEEPVLRVSSVLARCRVGLIGTFCESKATDTALKKVLGAPSVRLCWDGLARLRGDG